MQVFENIFLDHLYIDFFQMNNQFLTIISYYNKGLNNGNIYFKLFKKMFYINYYYYIKENMIKYQKKQAIKFF